MRYVRGRPLLPKHREIKRARVSRPSTPPRRSPSRPPSQSHEYRAQLAAYLTTLENVSDWAMTQFRDVVATPSRWRLLVVWALLVAAGLGLTLNLFALQVLEGPRLQERAAEQYQPQFQTLVPRRTIVDRRDIPLAIDRPVFNLYAHPKLFTAPPRDVAAELSVLLQESPAQLLEKFQSFPSGIPLADWLPQQTARQIARLRFDGLELIPVSRRSYPQKESAAAVVGYVDFDGLGQAGLEAAHNDVLKRNVVFVGDDAQNRGILDRAAPALARFDDLRLQLTLDMRLQGTAEAVLAQTMEEFQAQQGTVIVMDAWDGSVLSLVSLPSYDPNQYNDTPLERFRNWALNDLYEPGSTFKPLNVAIALEAGAIRPTDTFHDPGQIIVDGWPISNYDYAYAGGRGELTLTEILRDSSNVGMVRIMERMGASDYYDWLRRVELGELTQIDLPSETPGILKSRQEFLASPVEAATTSFGQGFAITPIQLVRLYGSLANGGYLVTPHVVQGLTDTAGQLQQPFPRPQRVRIFSEETVRDVVKMMEEAVEEGTGQNARIPGYRIAGKTGTAQKSLGDGGGYSSSAVVAGFVAIFPAEAPRYLVFVAVDEPSSGTGGQVAAPVSRAVIERMITLYQIPPS
ncbi:penicillin-binding protein 2 [Phormidium yuhuli AB48]|uniref:Penicillin-binding protein 2 n=1 Tax=Phormidium yuhuli AB48 TaxID=2940671 RepID=A0ABY5AY25_9CYAN|nr:penicillin-binding protein 2 [Phormidium yuhuli]USR92973.1 penicillin-binding protein 2 [Phormidium yuhuli AB48]